MDFFIDLTADTDSPCEVIGNSCRVLIIDDDEPGVLQWHEEQEHIRVGERECKLKILRRKGGSGKLTLKVNSEGGTAKSGQDFEPIEDLEGKIFSYLVVTGGGDVGGRREEIFVHK